MADESPVIRGAPRYLTGQAAGAAGVLALVPEAVLGIDGQTVRPTAIILLPPGAARRHPIPAARSGPDRRIGRTGVQAGPQRQEAARPASAAPRSDVAESQIVAGGPPPAEDPRIAAVFGPTRQTAHGVTIPLFEATLPPGNHHPRRTPIGSITIANGAVTVHVPPGSRASGLAPVLVGGALLVAGAYLLRRRQNVRDADARPVSPPAGRRARCV